jgi:DNA-binding response OmpR family regulator
VVATILVVEDERELNTLVRRHLEDEGHRVLQAFDGAAALQIAQQEHPDLVILDWMLPHLDGLEVCRRLRRESIVPILMLTARAEEVDRVLGLEVGADDYLVKPFSIRELLARVRAIFRRIELQGQAGSAEANPPLLEDGPLRVDVGEHVASVDGRPVELTPKEFDLLALLVRNPGRAFARDYLLDKVWGYDYGGLDTRTVDTHVLRLRKKLGAVGDRIETVWGVGYRFARSAQRQGSRRIASLAPLSEPAPEGTPGGNPRSRVELRSDLSVSQPEGGPVAETPAGGASAERGRPDCESPSEGTGRGNLRRQGEG